MAVYVFYDVARGRARIHAASCIYCMDGKGIGQLKERAAITGWSPKFVNSREAWGYVRARFPKFRDVAVCAACDPTGA
jgi:hypothetical protein